MESQSGSNPITDFRMSLRQPRILLLLISAAAGVLGFLLAFNQRPASVSHLKTIKGSNDQPLKETVSVNRSPRNTLAVALSANVSAFDSSKLEQLWQALPRDEFFTDAAFLKQVEAHPAEIHAWLETGKRWPLFDEEVDDPELVTGQVFTAWAAKDPPAALNAALQCPNFKRRGNALRALALCPEPSIAPKALGAYLKEEKYGFLFGDAFSSDGRSVQETLTLLQSVEPSPGRDARIASYLNQSSQSSLKEVVAHWSSLSSAARSSLVHTGFMGSKAAATGQFPELLQLAQAQLATLEGTPLVSQRSAFWNGIGGAWAREDFPAAWQWFQANSPELSQMVTESQLLSHGFEKHSEAVLAAVRELPSLTREVQALAQIKQNCRPALRPLLKEITAELPTEAQRMIGP
jgi:hypothetical protein